MAHVNRRFREPNEGQIASAPRKRNMQSLRREGLLEWPKLEPKTSEELRMQEEEFDRNRALQASRSLI